ncbi:MAG TPA: DUF3472 domain-containing protein, partial [Acidimicrobiales bacterium]|nr:DUF3472 domain-containing protein [Acidimicrobiales bacterium]
MAPYSGTADPLEKENALSAAHQTAKGWNVSTFQRGSEHRSNSRRLMPYGIGTALGLLGLIVGSGSAIAQTQRPAPLPTNVASLSAAGGLATTAPAPPQTYSYWTLPTSSVTGYYRVSQNVTPDNMPTASAGQGAPTYFYAMQWYNAGNLAEGGYTGLQTDSQGKKAIFSWWGGINGHSSGISQPFGAEGVGWQTIIPYNWQAGHTYKLTVNNTSTTSSGVWFTATILDVQTNRTSTIGSIEIPSSLGGIWEYLNNFVEWYGAAQPACAGYPLSQVTFSAPRGRDKAGDATVSSAAGVPPSSTPNGT